jgi:2-hydroxy-3-keto-5-methylthiopentenyl-1-phosphate phosphatase
MSAPPPPESPSGIFVSDFDGTMTEHDFFELVRRAWPIPVDEDPWERYVAGEITHFAALAAIFGRIRASEQELRQLVARMELDPHLPAAIARLRAAGWQIEIASAGCDWYIRQLLAPVADAVTWHANPGEYAPRDGLTMTLPQHSPYCCTEVGIDKSAVVRAALARAERVAFAGDGRPDLAPALLVPPERRYARGWLADHLREQQIPFQTFTRWSEIADRLLSRVP